jgi:hypothetical protein
LKWQKTFKSLVSNKLRFPLKRQLLAATINNIG